MELNNYHALRDHNPVTLQELISRLDSLEALENPDLIANLSDLRMTPDQTILVPNRGEFSLTDWSKRQLANLTGIKYDRWFQNASGPEKAEEMNRRFLRATSPIKVRTYRSADTTNVGTLRAFVSPSYMPISDSFVGSLVYSALQRSESEFPIIRANITAQSISYAIRVGRPHLVAGSLGEVGDIWGGIQIINSGVGYSSLSITLHLTRLICKNGMTAPLADANLLRRRHQGDIEMQLWERISSRLVGIGDKLNRGIQTLVDSRNVHIDDPRQAIEAVLRQAHLPKRMVEPLMIAFQREPHPSAFGISQALTDSNMHQELGLSPEERTQIEDAAGSYLQSVTRTV
jgi:hypothetical protein